MSSTNWQQYDYDGDGYLESGKELQDYNAQVQREAEEWRQTSEELTNELDRAALNAFWDATQQGSHYLLEAGQAMADAALLVARAAEVVGWLGTAFRWLGYIVPGASAVADVIDRVENISEEKALKASFYALSVVAVNGMELAIAGWDAMMAGKVTPEAQAKAEAVVHQAMDFATGWTDIIFD